MLKIPPLVDSQWYINGSPVTSPTPGDRKRLGDLVTHLNSIPWGSGDPGRWWCKISLGDEPVFFLDQLAKIQKHIHQKPYKVITSSSDFIKFQQIQRTLADFFRLRSWVKYCESILKVAASCWAQPWLVYLPPLQMINLTTFWKWGQTAAWAGIVSGVRSNLRSSAIQCHWCGESRLEISWDILRWELLSRDFLFFETFGTQICGFEHGEIPSVERAMATSCTDISHIGGFLKWDEWGISIHLWWSMTTGWEHDENMMRTWWELDLCTYLRYSSVISTKVTLHYKWVYECIWFIWYDIMPMSYSPGLPPWRLRNLQMRSTRHRCHRNGLGNDVGAGWPSCQLWREKQSWVAMVLGSQQNDFKR